ncbi:MAG: restriction endonuclease [Acidobacteriaceae bacterium]
MVSYCVSHSSRSSCDEWGIRLVSIVPFCFHGEELTGKIDWATDFITVIAMADTWRDYQQSAAAFFRRLGLVAEVEYQVEGARGIHRVDVYVEGALHGIQFKWVIECKAWKSSVTKEKVMALAAIVQDLGADRGFLLSEVGFQSGALRAVRKTNITLTSLEDLSNTSNEVLADTAIGALYWRLEKAQRRLRRMGKEQYPDDYFPPVMAPLGKLFLLSSALDQGMQGEFPNVYRIDDTGRYEADSLDELLRGANEIISAAEAWLPDNRS